MKKFLMVAITLIASVSVFAQENDTVPSVKSFEDFTTGLYTTKVVEIEGKSQKELVNYFKNWVGVNFRSSKDVIVSETESQIVLNYITKTTGYLRLLGIKNYDETSWYVRVVAQFKDGKMRLMIYDDGNVFKAGTYSQYGSTPSIAARSLFIKNYTIKPESNKDLERAKGLYYSYHLKWQKYVDSTIKDAEESIKKGDMMAIAKTDNW